jgi:dTDP-4-dehydrorhamnose 3,5-epimerase
MSRHFNFGETTLPGLCRVERRQLSDDRGFLSRCYCAEEFAEIGMTLPVVQINHTLTRKKGTVRGMHYQRSPHAETKVVTCLRGEVWDVAIDIREGSSTFLKWHSEVLTMTNQVSLCIPAGFAHGFQALTDNCELLYLHTAAYERGAEGALNARDTRLAIDWPLPITEISERDQSHPMVDETLQGIHV